MAVTIHPLPASVNEVQPPKRFTYPFCYEPHPLCVAAADEVRRYLKQHPEWDEELQRGKMFGVLIAAPLRLPRGGESKQQRVSPRGDIEGAGGLSFLAAFSGTLDGKTQHDYFVPPVFDLMAPGCHFQDEEAAISNINRQIEALQDSLKPSLLREKMQEELSAYRELMRQHKAERDRLRKNASPSGEDGGGPQLVRQSQFEKAEYRRLKQRWEERIAADEAPLRETQRQIESLQQERHDRSVALQQWLFQQFVFLNALGEEKSLPELFRPAIPPSGAGECCAPRLLQAVYLNGLHPLCMAEFWVGASPKDELRLDGHYYPACNSKCRPILRHMLQGLDVEENPLLADQDKLLSQLHIIYNDGV